MEPGSIIVVHLVDPAEKYWGLLKDLTFAGVTVRAINLNSFNDWMGAIAYEEESPGLGPATIFFPLRRVERMFLDESVGQMESLDDLFKRRTGHSAMVYFDPLPVDEPSEEIH